MGKFCAKCGSELNVGAKFCPKCGAPTSKNENGKRVLNNKKQVSSRKIIERKEEKLSTVEKIVLGVAAFIALTGFFGGLSESMWIAAIVSFLAMAAIIAVFNGSIEKKYAWTTAICTFFAVCLAIGLSSPNESSKKFEAIEDGRAAYYLDSTKYENSDIQKLDLIIMYEGNSRKDCKAMGINSEGKSFQENGKWEKRDMPNMSSRYIYILTFNYFNLIIRDDSVVCYYRGSAKDKDAIYTAWSKGNIGKIRDLSESKERERARVFQKKVEEDKPISGSKDVSVVKSKIGHTVWTYTSNYGNPTGWWYRLKFNGSTCDVYSALPKNGEWKFEYSSPYSVVEKRLDDGKRYVFVYLKYSRDTDGSMYEPPFPIGINITEGSFIQGALGAVGFIDERDYKWD